MNMKNLSIANNIIPLGEFKSGLSKYINKTKESGEPLVITQNGRAAAVVLSPHDYDNLVYGQRFAQSISRGIADADSGKMMNTKELKKQLEEHRQGRISE
jgi:prevent-host-death family protein